MEHDDATSPKGSLPIIELIDITGRFLDRHSLAMCLRVCHQWHGALQYQLWEVLEKRMGMNDHQGYIGPPLPLISKFAHHIRKLHLRLDAEDIRFPGKRTIRCPVLAELTVKMVCLPRAAHTRARVIEENLATFIAEHQASLQKLVLHLGQSRALTDAMAACSRLESLTTPLPYLRWMDWYKNQGSRLQSLTLIGQTPGAHGDDWSSDFGGRFEMDNNMNTLLAMAPVSSLWNLVIEAGSTTHSSLQEQMLLVIKSPELRRLAWSGFWTINHLAEAFQKSHHRLFCQKLESLSIHGHGEINLIYFRRVVESLPLLTDLDLSRSSGPGIISCLICPYLATLRLRRLKIDKCVWVTATAIQNVLCSMAGLQVLIVDCITDTAIGEDPRPWICTGLRELSVGIAVCSGLEGYGLILERLATLERLESLTVLSGRSHVLSWAAAHANEVEVENMQLLLERGLDLLKSLKQLRTLKVDHAVTTWGVNEAQWALQNWVHLIGLDIAVNQEAGILLQHRLLENDD